MTERRKEILTEKKMNIYMDLHTHTLAGGHGYSTLKENIEAAQEAGLKILGLSEHGPAIPGGPHPFFFGNYKCIPRQYGCLRLLCGVEANIMDWDGGLDLEDELLGKMDYVIASMHVPCVKSGSREENTLACIHAMKNPRVKILGHPDDARFPLDYDMLVQAAKEEKVALEVNNSSLHPKSARKGARENIMELLAACRKYGAPVLLGTDSHICYSIGRFEAALSLIREVDFPEELVLNCCPEAVEDVVNI